MKLEAPALGEDGRITQRFVHKAIGGENRSLPFRWSDAPPETQSFALSIVDPHPMANNLVHWLVINISAGTGEIRGGASGGGMPPGSSELRNGFGEAAYTGPKPPPGSGEQNYVCTLYALDVSQVEVTGGTTLEAFQGALEGHVLAQAQVIGKFGH